MNATPTKEQFEAKLTELRNKRLDLIHETGKTTAEEWFIQEELEDVEAKIQRYKIRMIELYGN